MTELPCLSKASSELTSLVHIKYETSLEATMLTIVLIHYRKAVATYVLSGVLYQS